MESLATADAYQPNYGRYDLIRPLTETGVFELWLARVHGLGGFEKSGIMEESGAGQVL